MLCLTAATGLVCVTALLTLAQPRWPLWQRASWRLLAFVGLSLLLVHIVGSPLHPDFAARGQTADVWLNLIEAAWWVIGARGLVGVVRLLVVLKHRPRETQIISDLLAGLIYVGALLAVISIAFQVPIAGLVATSGIAAIVLGLALQSTLSDVFSGIAVGLERPFKAGDLLWVEGGNIEGRVVQVNWRSTQIATGDGNIAIVPNSILAKARLVNRSLPTPVRREKIELRIATASTPERVITTMKSAVCACQLLMDEPSPAVECTSLEGDGNIYRVWFSIPDADHLSNARTELLTQLRRHLRYASIPLGVPGLATVPKVAPLSAVELMEQSDLFGGVEASHRETIAGHLTDVALNAGEMLIQQDMASTALFIVASGTLEITRQRESKIPWLVHRMGPGESVGAIGLFTGEPYAATATAMTQVSAYRLDKMAIAAAVAEMPALRDGLEALASRGQAVLRADASAREHPAAREPAMFLARLRQFISLLGT